MENKQPLLSICIPTYNRADVLKQCLESIVVGGYYDGEVEVIVSDNCSSDNTFEVVNEYVLKYQYIYYYRNDTNIGGDRNILKSLELSTGVFLKITNDYSIFTEGAISKLLQTIKENEDKKPVIYFNQRENLEYCLFNTLDDVVVREKWAMSWIGSYGYWKEDFDSWTNRDARISTMFQQVDWFVRSYRRSRIILYVCFPLTTRKETRSKQGGYDFIKVHTTNFFIQFRELVLSGDLKKDSFIKLKKHVLVCMLAWIKKLKVDNGKTYRYEYNNPYSQLFFEYKRYLWFYVILIKFELKYYTKTILAKIGLYPMKF